MDTALPRPGNELEFENGDLVTVVAADVESAIWTVFNHTSREIELYTLDENKNYSRLDITEDVLEKHKDEREKWHD